MAEQKGIKVSQRVLMDIRSPLIGDIALGKIPIYSSEGKINPILSVDGVMEGYLEDYLLPRMQNYAVFTGEVLNERLKERRNVSDLTQLLISLNIKNEKLLFHVDADFAGESESVKIYRHFDKPENMTDREFLWYSSLDLSLGGFVGYPGYEHPDTSEHFNFVCEEFCKNFLLGRSDQLDRIPQMFSKKKSLKKVVGEAKRYYAGLKSAYNF